MKVKVKVKALLHFFEVLLLATVLKQSEKEINLKRFDPNDKEASTVHFTQLIKRKAMLLSADGEFNI